MATTSTIAEAVLRARAYYIQLLDEYLVMLRGGGDCGNHQQKLLCLKKLIRGLQWDLADDINDDITTGVYGKLILEMDGYFGDVLPEADNVMIPGVTILAGIAGPAGAKGDKGDKGDPGINAYELAVAELGYEGTLEDWLNEYKTYIDLLFSQQNLQKVTDIGNRTDNDIILEESDLIFEAPVASKMAVNWVNDGLSRTIPPASLNIVRNPNRHYIDKATGDVYVPDEAGGRVLKFNINGHTSGKNGVLVAGTGVSTAATSGVPSNLLDSPTQFQKVGNDFYVMDTGNKRLLKYTNGVLNPTLSAWAMASQWHFIVKDNGDIYLAFSNQLKYLPVGTSPNAYDGWIYSNSILSLQPVHSIYQLRLDSQQRIWAATNAGIYRLNSNTQNDHTLIVPGSNINHFTFGESEDVVYYTTLTGHKIFKYTISTAQTAEVFGTGTAGSGADQLSDNIRGIDYVNGKLYYMDYVAGELKTLDGNAIVSKLPKGLSINTRRILTEDDLKADPDLTPFATKTQIDDINDVRLPGKVDKDPSQAANRILFVDPDTGKIIGQGNFTFDKYSGQIKVNSMTNNGNYKAIIGGGMLIETGVFTMNEYQSVMNMSAGRCALIVDGNGMHYRLFNNDETNFPDTSKSFVWRNKGFVHFRCYTEVVSLNGQGQPSAWRQINEFQKFVRMPDLPVSSGSYNVIVQNNASKELQLVAKDLLSARRNVMDLPLIDNGDLSGIADYEEYRTSEGLTKYKLPVGTGPFKTAFKSAFKK